MSDLVSYLVSRGSISFLAMDAAVRRWRKEGGRLATSVLETTDITPDGILEALCGYTGLPPARDAMLAHVDPDLAEMFNADRALRIGAMPLSLDHRGLVLGVLTRLTPIALEELAEEFSSKIEQRIILEFRFFELLNRFYGHPIEGRFLMLSSRFPLAETDDDEFADDFFKNPTPAGERRRRPEIHELHTPAKPLTPIDALVADLNADDSPIRVDSPEFNLLKNAQRKVARIHESRLRRKLAENNDDEIKDLFQDDSFDAAFSLGADTNHSRRSQPLRTIRPISERIRPLSAPANHTDAQEPDQLPAIEPIVQLNANAPIAKRRIKSIGMEPIMPGALHNQKSRAIDPLHSFWENDERKDATNPIDAVDEDHVRRDTTAEQAVQDAHIPDVFPPPIPSVIDASSDDSIARHLGFWGQDSADHVDPNAFVSSTLGQDWSAAQLSAFFAGPRTRDELLNATFGYTERFFKRRFFLRVSNDNKTYVVAMQGAEPTSVDIAKVAIPYTDDSTIAKIRAEMTYFAGPPQDVGLSTLYTRLHIERPQEMVVFPIRISDRAVMLLAADSGPNTFVDRSRIDDIFYMLSQLGLALQRLITSNLRARQFVNNQREREPTGLTPTLHADKQRENTSPVESTRPDTSTAPVDNSIDERERTGENRPLSNGETPSESPNTTQNTSAEPQALVAPEINPEILRDSKATHDENTDDNAATNNDATKEPKPSTKPQNSPEDDEYIRSLLDYDDEKSTIAVPAAIAQALATVSNRATKDDDLNTNESEPLQIRGRGRAAHRTKSNWGADAINSLLDLNTTTTSSDAAQPTAQPTASALGAKPETPADNERQASRLAQAAFGDEPEDNAPAEEPPTSDDTNAEETNVEETGAGETDAGETDAGETSAGETNAGETNVEETNVEETGAGDSNAGGLFSSPEFDELFGVVDDIEKSFSGVLDVTRARHAQSNDDSNAADENANPNETTGDSAPENNSDENSPLFAHGTTEDIDPLTDIISLDDDWSLSDSQLALLVPPPPPSSDSDEQQRQVTAKIASDAAPQQPSEEPNEDDVANDNSKSDAPAHHTERLYTRAVVVPTRDPSQSSESGADAQPEHDSTEPETATTPTQTLRTKTIASPPPATPKTPPLTSAERTAQLRRALPPRPASLRDALSAPNETGSTSTLPPPPPATQSDEIRLGARHAGGPPPPPPATQSEEIRLDAFRTDDGPPPPPPATVTETSTLVQLADIPENQRRAATRVTQTVSESIANSVFGEEEFSDAQIEHVLNLPASELPSIVSSFPGVLLLNRHLPEQDARPVREHSQLLSLVDARLHDWLPDVWACLERRDANARYYALRLLALVRGLELRYPLIEALFDEDRQVQRLALALVESQRTHLDFHTVLDAVRSTLTSEDPGRREAAIIAVERLRDTESIPRLLDLLADPTPEVSDQARDALMRLTFVDFGFDGKRWREWQALHGRELPLQWLVDAMTALEPLRRELAARALAQMPNLAVNYHPDMSEKALRRARLAAERHFGLR